MPDTDDFRQIEEALTRCEGLIETDKRFQSELVRAARLTLETLANMTAEQFERGADRECRRALAKALNLDPADYSL